MTRPRIIGHRGAAAHAPENTLAGLFKAKALGARWVELDVQLTQDGCPILLHDLRLDRTTSGKGAAARRSLAEIRRLDAGGWFGPEFAGERVPSLEEALAVLDELQLGAVFEIKAARGRGAETARAALEVLRRRWPAREPPPILSSADPDAVAAARDAAPAIERALIVGGVPIDWRARVAALAVGGLHADERRLDRARAAAVAAELPLFAYTVNGAERARQLLDWGLAGIFTDRPDLLISALEHT